MILKKVLLIILASIFLFSSCTTLSHTERTKLEELKAAGIKIPHEEIKNPGAAGALNILPGFGNFYLAIGDYGDSSHWLYGFLNLLLWPVSIIWAVPEGAIDAQNLNKRHTVYYYTFGSGKKELEKIKQ